MSANPYLGEISMFAGSFAPRGWAFCNGQLLAINSNSALYSLLGTTYGGDGRTTFGLPDLRSRVPLHVGSDFRRYGQGPGLSPYMVGQKTGLETTTITTLNLPNHTHSALFRQTAGVANIGVVADTANSDDPTGRSLATPDVGGNNFIYSDEVPTANLKPDAVQVAGDVQVLPTGNQQPFNNIQPVLGINYIISLLGIFPSRS